MTYQESYDQITTILNGISRPEERADCFNQVIKEIGNIHRYYLSGIDVLERDAIKHGREIEAMKDWAKRVTDENNAKLMAIFYSLDTLRTCGTHHEKSVVLTHLMATIDRMLNKENEGLSYKNDDLPF